MRSLRRRLPETVSLPRLSGVLIVQATIILVVLALSMYLSRKPTMVMLLACAAVAGLYLTLRQPWLGPVGALVAGLVVRFNIGTGTQSAIPLMLVMIMGSLGLWVAEHLYRRSFRVTFTRAYWPLLAMSTIAVLAFIAGSLRWIPFADNAPLRSQLGGTGIFLLSAGAFVITANQIRSERQLKLMVWVFLFLAGVYMLARAAPGLSALQHLIHGNAVGSVFWVWVVALALAQALFNRELNWVWRLALLGLTGLTLSVGLTGAAREWASGWLPALAAVGVMVYLRWPRLGLLAGFIGIIAGLLAAPALLNALPADEAYSLTTRTAAWEIILRIAEASPLIGIGPANYYFYTPLFPILGWYVQFNSHNQYVDIIAQVGFLGLAAILWFFFEAGRQGWRIYRQAPAGFSKAFAAACVAGVVGMLAAGMLGDWLLPFVYNVGLTGTRGSLIGWLFLGGLVVVAHHQARRQAAPAGEAEARPPA